MTNKRQIQTQLCISDSPQLRAEVKPVTNDEESAYVKKPKRGTGLWTSTWVEDSGSAWVGYEREYCDLAEKYWYLLTPRQESNIYVIEDYTDLERLIHGYSWETKQLKEMIAIYDQVSGKIPCFNLPTRSVFLSPRIYYLDFERISQDYDGIWLTYEGWADTKFDIYHEYDLSSWSCESTLWFRWSFERVETIQPIPVVVESE